MPADTLAAVTLTYLFVYLDRTAYGRNEYRRMVVARPNCSRIDDVECCNHALRMPYDVIPGVCSAVIAVCESLHLSVFIIRTLSQQQYKLLR